MSIRNGEIVEYPFSQSGTNWRSMDLWREGFVKEAVCAEPANTLLCRIL